MGEWTDTEGCCGTYAELDEKGWDVEAVSGDTSWHGTVLGEGSVGGGATVSASAAWFSSPSRESSPPPLRAARVAGSFSIRERTSVMRCIRVACRVGRACAISGMNNKTINT
jgi:hypothetical protein